MLLNMESGSLDTLIEPKCRTSGEQKPTVELLMYENVSLFVLILNEGHNDQESKPQSSPSIDDQAVS